MLIEKKWIYKYGDWKLPHEARPYLDSPYKAKMFNTRPEAVRYLNDETGYFLGAQEWVEIGKLRPIR
jgi:hypothetical protein